MEATVEVYYKLYPEPFLLYDDTAYFGEISYLFKTRNFYRFKIQDAEQNKKFKVYSINKNRLDDIFTAYPDFKDVLKIRALRRQHYYRQLRNQQINYELLRHNKQVLVNRDKFIDELLNIKKARLYQHNMTYEELVKDEMFSDDEMTLQYNKIRNKEAQNVRLLAKARKLKHHISNLKQFQIDGMRQIIGTITDMDQATREIFFRKFDKNSFSLYQKDGTQLLYELQNLEQQA